MRTRVKNMSRQQQKAVFANKGNPSSSTLSNSDRDKVLEKEFRKKSKAKLEREQTIRTLKNLPTALSIGIKTLFARKKDLTPAAKKLFDTPIGSKKFKERLEVVKKQGSLFRKK